MIVGIENAQSSGILKGMFLVAELVQETAKGLGVGEEMNITNIINEQRRSGEGCNAVLQTDCQSLYQHFAIQSSVTDNHSQRVHKLSFSLSVFHGVSYPNV